MDISSFYNIYVCFLLNPVDLSKLFGFHSLKKKLTTFCNEIIEAPPKLYNQVPSLSLRRWRTFILEKNKIDCVLWCIKLQTIVSCWEEYCESMHSWLLSEVWNIIAPNLSIFSTEKIPRILNHQMVQGGDLIS